VESICEFHVTQSVPDSFVVVVSIHRLLDHERLIKRRSCVLVIFQANLHIANVAQCYCDMEQIEVPSGGRPHRIFLDASGFLQGDKGREVVPKLKVAARNIVKDHCHLWMSASQFKQSDLF